MSSTGSTGSGAPADGQRDQGSFLTFRARAFDDLTRHELHDIFRLRIGVFIIEQQCLYPEIDGLDPQATHLLGDLGGEIVAYARWYPKGNSQVLGRILTSGRYRHRGFGRQLMARSLELIGNQKIRISAQAHLESFYRDLGFETTSPVYDDFGIPHVDMERAPEPEPSC